MMNNLFSSFDPSTWKIKTSWMIFMVVILMMTAKKKKMMMIMMKKVSTEFSNNMKEKNKKGVMSMMISMFFVIMIMNLTSMIPFTFTMTSQMSMNLQMALMMWLIPILISMLKNTKNMMIHLTPTGTPTPLMNFMVLIETISLNIRPITLSVRLTANMTAGHLLMHIMTEPMISNMNSKLILMPTMLLITLEMAVAIIQAYVFTTLVSLYTEEA